MTPKGKAVWIDGTLYVCIAMFLALQTTFSSEEAYSYVNPYALFWLKAVLGTLGAGAGALKMFRSTTFSDSKDELQAVEEANPTVKPPTPPTPPATGDTDV